MKPNNLVFSALTIAALLLFSSTLAFAAPSAAPAKKEKEAAAAPASKGKEFDNPKAAADALVAAAETFDVNALKEILGPDSTDVVSSEDAVADKNRAESFATRAKEKLTLGADGKNPNRVLVTVGNDDFPLPI